MNDFLKLACERYSVRQYSNKPIEDEKLEKILKAGQVAPTAANRQPQRVFVIKSEESLEKLRFFTPFCYNAPIVLMMCYDRNVSGKAIDGHDSGIVDATIALTHMMLEAYDLGIGSVWVRGYDSRILERIFNLPENLVSVALLPIGYPSQNSKPIQLHYNNISIEDMVTYL
ncbi:nitroreductase family protein [Methanobrevibacter sp.]|uniref:nitroreductase family protein n=1 Tax=Methanobrevibacter sp. TaxID=66852 RepID=UPI00388DE014